MDPAGTTGKLCNWINNLTLDDIPAEVKTRAKYLILDGVACALVGAHLPWSEKGAEAILGMEPAGDCAVFGWNKVWFWPLNPQSQINPYPLSRN
jgi:aconitate decarboxylase